MARYKLPQQDLPALRWPRLTVRKNAYRYERSLGIPLNESPYAIKDLNGPEWVRQLLEAILKVNSNATRYIQETSYEFANSYPPRLLTDQLTRFAKAASSGDPKAFLEAFKEFGPSIGKFILPDLGPTVKAANLEDYKAIFATMPLPEIAHRFDTDESFANNFVAGPNPGVIKRLNSVPANFPITSAHLQSVAEFAGDSLEEALSEGRVYVVDHSGLSILQNGKHYGEIQKYIYAPWAAFALPRGGGRLYPFAIQCGPSPEGRMIYTPVDGYSWKIAKNCVLAAHNTHHELASHLGLTHYLMEPFVVATRRHLAERHPISALLTQHFEGTILINYAATNSLIKPNKSVDRLIGADLPSAYVFVRETRLNYSFRQNYLPDRLRRHQTDDATLLQHYPYRDDGLLIWNATQQWIKEFVETFYEDDASVVADYELQAWAAEIAAEDGGQVKDFGDTPGKILSRADLIGILTMVLFTAGPQHAAVNFPQGSDMAFMPANPLAGYTPEPLGLGHTEADWLANLPPLEVGVSTLAILTLLSHIQYTSYGQYDCHPNGLMKDFSEGAIGEALARHKSRLEAAEREITRRNESRAIPYIHLLPSRIPQSINI